MEPPECVPQQQMAPSLATGADSPKSPQRATQGEVEAGAGWLSAGRRLPSFHKSSPFCSQTGQMAAVTQLRGHRVLPDY